MAINYSTTVKNSRLTAVRDAIDGGSGAGVLKIFTSAYGTLLATLTLSDPCGTVSAGVLTMSGMPKTATVAASGTAAIARYEDSTGTVVADGLTVGTSGTDVIVSSTTFTISTTAQLNSATITHAA